MRPTTHSENERDSSEPSSSSISVDSALQSTAPASDRERQSSMSSLDPVEESEESMSSVSSNDESDSNDSVSESEDEVATIRTQKKPDFSAPSLQGAGDLHARLRAFLPQIADANSRLATEGTESFTMEDVGDEEPHIEMNLGLGVLEEKGDQSSEDSECNEDEDKTGSHSAETRAKDGDVMGKLLGRPEDRKGGVEEVG